MMEIRHYFTLWAKITGALILVTALINLTVDPYGLFRMIEVEGVNTIKPKSGAHGAMVKAYQVLRIQPRTLILGNSRSEVGFDPSYSVWPSRPVYNLALPGTGTSTSVQYLRHALVGMEKDKTAKIEYVIWGIDLMDFLVDERKPPPHKAAQSGRQRLLTSPDGSLNPYRSWHQGRDYAESLFSLGTLFDSMRTVGSQNSHYSPELTALGFNPMNDYTRIARDEGYWAMFQQRNSENIKAYLRRPKGIYDSTGRSSPAMDDLRQIMRLCRENGITLHLVIYPYHAHLMETFRITGHWQAFEDWKRAVVAVVSEESRQDNKKPISLWDFSGFNALTTEVVPAKGDRKTTMHWYWEAGHFKHELGNLMLDRIFGGSETVPGFGVLLDAANVETHMAAIKTQELAYRKNFPRDVEALEQMALKR